MKDPTQFEPTIEGARAILAIVIALAVTAAIAASTAVALVIFL